VPEKLADDKMHPTASQIQTAQVQTAQVQTTKSQANQPQSTHPQTRHSKDGQSQKAHPQTDHTQVKPSQPLHPQNNLATPPNKETSPETNRPKKRHQQSRTTRLIRHPQIKSRQSKKKG